MKAPNRNDALAAFARRILNVSKSLEQAARAGRGILPAQDLAALWYVQQQAYALQVSLDNQAHAR